MVENINKINEEINLITEKLWKCKDDAYQILAEKIPLWQSVLLNMLEDMYLLKEYGVDIPFDIIEAQLANLECALEKKDTCMLADVLKYELAETLKYYKGLIEMYGWKE